MGQRGSVSTHKLRISEPKGHKAPSSLLFQDDATLIYLGRPPLREKLLSDNTTNLVFGWRHNAIAYSSNLIAKFGLVKFL